MGGGGSRPKIPAPEPAAPPVAIQEIDEMEAAKRKARRPRRGRESTRLAGQMTQARTSELKQILG